MQPTLNAPVAQPVYRAPVTQYNDVITSQVAPMMPVQQRPVVTTYSAPEPAVVTTQVQATSSARGQKGLDIEPVYLVMGLGKKEHPCLLDSGCEKTLVPLSVVQALRKAYIRPTSFQITCVNDTTLDVVGEVVLPFMLRDKCIPTPALVTPDVDEIMLGVEWLTEHQCLWDFANGRIFINGTVPVPLTTRRNANCRRVYVKESVVLPPRQQVDVVSRTPLLPERTVEPVIVDTHELGPGVYVARTLMNKGMRDMKVRVINTTSKTQQLDAGRCLRASEPVEIVESTTSDSASSIGNKS